jgi:hypothetical protein
VTDRQLHSSKAPDAAVVLPLFGAFLLMPPVISLFAAPMAIWHVPLIVLYIFGVWAGLILCAILLARHLASTPPLPPSSGTEVSTDSGQRSEQC